MTYSDCWIDTVDDPWLADLIRSTSSIDVTRAAKPYLFPPPPRSGLYWINIVREWAGRQGLPVEYVDPLEIRAAVSRDQLLQFLTDTYGADMAACLKDMAGFVQGRLQDKYTYLLCADEF